MRVILFSLCLKFQPYSFASRYTELRYPFHVAHGQTDLRMIERLGDIAVAS
jgi:hypothetical protein